jgi:DNA-binding LytR/AlgR family response regulator
MQARLKCLLIDDEPPALQILKSYIHSIPSLEIAGEFNNALAAFGFIQQQHVDLIFLDINMPGLSGIELVRSLQNPPRIIFTTAHRDYALDGFDLGAVDYLLKPVSLDRFLKAIFKLSQVHQRSAEENHEVSTEKFLYFRADRKMIKVMLRDIQFIESLKDYIRINTTKGNVITRHSISSIEAMLPENEFVRIHRSFIVAINKIDSYNHTDIFIGKTELPIGPLYKHEISKRFQMQP